MLSTLISKHRDLSETVCDRWPNSCLRWKSARVVQSELLLESDLLRDADAWSQCVAGHMFMRAPDLAKLQVFS